MNLNTFSIHTGRSQLREFDIINRDARYLEGGAVYLGQISTDIPLKVHMIYVNARDRLRRIENQVMWSGSTIL